MQRESVADRQIGRLGARNGLTQRYMPLLRRKEEGGLRRWRQRMRECRNPEGKGIEEESEEVIGVGNR